MYLDSSPFFIVLFTLEALSSLGEPEEDYGEMEQFQEGITVRGTKRTKGGLVGTVLWEHGHPKRSITKSRAGDRDLGLRGTLPPLK